MDKPIIKYNYFHSKKRIFFVLYLARTFSYLFLIIILSACNNQKPSVNIAVASNFESTLKKIITRYQENNKTIQINIIPGSSGMLANQIINKAPYDLFLSADSEKAEIVYQNIKPSLKPETYGIGQLALWIPSGIPNNQCLQQLNTIKSLVIANPKTAPYGSLSQKIIWKHDIKAGKTIQSANILQSYLFTKDKLVEAGFVAYSQLKNTDLGCRQIFQDKLLKQSIVLINNNAKEIYNYILSKDIQLFIKNSGYNIEPSN